MMRLSPPRWKVSINRKFLLIPFLLVSGTLNLSALEETKEVTKLPSEWLSIQEKVWQDNGWESRRGLPDVLLAQYPPTGEKEYYLLLPEGKMTREEWHKKSFTGTSYPEPRKPFRRLAVGTMLYNSEPAKIKELFKAMKDMGMNSVVLCTYIKPEQWREVEESAEEYDIDIIIQYHSAYFRPERGRTFFEKNTLPKALGLLERCHSSRRVIGFAVKEEVYTDYLSWLQEYHAALKKHYPEMPLYLLYNATPAMVSTQQPAAEIMGTDIYPFLGGYFGGGRQKPSFLTPQSALRNHLNNHLRYRSEEALLRGAVFTYTPAMFGYHEVRSEGDMEKNNIPRKIFPGVDAVGNGYYILWRRYSPPPNAMRASVWLSAAYGAKGWFPWYYPIKSPDTASIPESPTKHYRTDWSLKGAENSPVWKEYVETTTEMQRFEDILLRLLPDGFPRFETEDGLLIGRTFRIPPDLSGSVVILVNLDVGRWEGYPNLDMRKRNLDVDRYGILTGYQPLKEARRVEFYLRIAPGETVRDMGSGKILKPEGRGEGSLHKFSMEIEPGGGLLLFIGTDTDKP